MSFWKSFGPGVLFAGAAIGTSHLVQSTRAGALFGLGLLCIVVLVNVIKYPAYRFGPQYAAVTGKSLIEGYLGLGKGVVLLFLASEIVVIPIVIAATAIVTAGILAVLSGAAIDPRHMASAVIVLAAVMMSVGGYKLLDRMTKVFVAILTIATITATVLSLPRIDWSFAALAPPTFDIPTFVFVIALMGFMPAGLELSVLQSLWSVAKTKEMGQRPSLSNAVADFNLGYWGAAVLAVCFLLMGAGVMHESGVVPEASAVGFAAQVIALYTTNLGEWAGTLVALSAFFVMFTTLITILDGLPRLVAASFVSLRNADGSPPRELDRSPLLLGTMTVLSVAAIAVLQFLMSNFRAFIDFVTITAFVVAAIVAVLNHLVMFSGALPKEDQPSLTLRVWSIAGIVFLSVLSLVFLYVKIRQ